jgi:hypothetical protein
MCFTQCLRTLCVSCLRSPRRIMWKESLSRRATYKTVIMYKLFLSRVHIDFIIKFFATCCCEVVTVCVWHLSCSVVNVYCVVMRHVVATHVSVAWYHVCVLCCAVCVAGWLVLCQNFFCRRWCCWCCVSISLSLTIFIFFFNIIMRLSTSWSSCRHHAMSCHTMSS